MTEEKVLELVEGLPGTFEFLRRRVSAYSPRLIEKLLDRIEDVRMEDPKMAATLSQFAIDCAANLCTKTYPVQQRIGVCAKASAVLGGCLRTLSEFVGARAAYMKAVSLLMAGGTTTPTDLTQILVRLAFLYMDLGQYQKALAYTARAIEIALTNGTQRDVAFAYVAEAAVLFQSADLLGAQACYEASLETIDPKEKRTHLAAVQGYARCLCESPDSEISLERVRILFSEVKEKPRLFCIFEKWTTGLANRTIGDYKTAEVLIKSALSGFSYFEMPLQIGMTKIDLAICQLRLGKIGDAFSNASEAMVVFQALGIGGDTLSSYLVLNRSNASLVELETSLLAVRRAASTHRVGAGGAASSADRGEH